MKDDTAESSHTLRWQETVLVQRALRVGLAGGGAIADVYARALAETPAAELTALADPSPLVRARREQEWVGVAMRETYHELLADPLDLIVLALPHHTHAEALIAALGSGKAVVCEKPLALDLRTAEKVVRQHEASAGRAIVRTYLRAVGFHAWTRQALTPAVLGAPRLFRGYFGSDRLAALADPDDWHGDWEKAGGGVLADSGYHLIDLARFLIGEVETASAEMSRDGGLPDNCAEDMASVTLTHRNGATSSFDCVWTDHSLPFRWERSIYAAGGIVHIRDDNGRVLLDISRRGMPRTVASFSDWWMKANVRSAVNCITSFAGSPLDAGVASLDDATETLRTVLACYYSAQEGRPVSPHEVPADYSPNSRSLNMAKGSGHSCSQFTKPRSR